MNQKRKSILCPNCGKLISADELRCPYCDIRRPGSWRANNFLTRGLLDTDQLIKMIIYVNIGMYVISLLFNPLLTNFSLNPLSFLSPDNNSLLLLGATGTIPVDKFHRWWSLLSANYLHGGILHILFNMFAFKQLAPLVSAGCPGIRYQPHVYHLYCKWGHRLLDILPFRCIIYYRRVCIHMWFDRCNALLWQKQGWSIRTGNLQAGCWMDNRTFSFRFYCSGYKQLGTWWWNSCRHSFWIHSGLSGEKTRTFSS